MAICWSHTIHVWYVSLPTCTIEITCRPIYHTWMVWEWCSVVNAIGYTSPMDAMLNYKSFHWQKEHPNPSRIEFFSRYHHFLRNKPHATWDAGWGFLSISDSKTIWKMEGTQFPKGQDESKVIYLGGGKLKYVFYSHPDPWAKWSNLTCAYFFKWVGEKAPTPLPFNRLRDLSPLPRLPWVCSKRLRLHPNSQSSKKKLQG